MTEKRKIEYDCAYMDMAKCMGKLSYAVRAKVGAIIVSKNGQIISQGFNGTPTGQDNTCEHVVCMNIPAANPLNSCFRYKDISLRTCVGCEHCKLVTKESVLHAESNAIAKCAKWHNSTEGSTIYITLSPCYECSKLIIQAGISRVVFLEKYRTTEGIDLLKSAGIVVEQLDIENKTLKLL